ICSSRRRHTRSKRDWSSDVCSSDLTLLVGFGIAICNVLLPGVIKEKFPLKVAIMTSAYTTSMSIFATAASGLSIPLSEGLQLGWQKTLLVWAVPAIIGVMIWLFILKNSQQEKKD